jgi:hypothetical protein
MEEVGHSSLDYNDVKQPSLSSRSYRVKIMPENGSSFKAGQVVYLSLPSGLPATYVDFRSNVYLKFDMTVDGTVVLDKAFALSWIRRLAIESTGTLLNDIQGFNVLLAMSNDLQVNPLTKMNQMSVTSGAGQVIGNTLTAGTYTFCVPIPLNVFSMAQRAIPLFSNDKLTLRLTVDDAVKWGKWTVAPNENNNVITNLELTCDFNELDSQAQMMIDQAVGGVYNIMTTGIQNFQSTLSTVTGPTNINRQIGISVASLDRMFFVFREAVNLNSNTKFGIGGRCNPKLTSAQLFINNLAIPQRPLRGTSNNNAEFYTETLIAENALHSIDFTNSINQIGTVTCSVGATQATQPYNFELNKDQNDADSVGSFCFGINLSTLTHGEPDLFGGMNTISSNVQVRLEVANTEDVIMDIFSYYTQLITLNSGAGGMNVFQTSF